MTTQIENIRIIPLGGVGEIGKNMYVVEVENQLFILDSGYMMPEDEMLGIDIVIPDLTYIIENKARVKAIFLSHGHDDQIGALPFLLRHVQCPVYGAKLTLTLAKAQLKEHGYKGKHRFFEIDSNRDLTFGETKVSFFRTNHTIPDSFGICIHTDQGAIVYSGDFKFDQSATGKYRADLGKMAQIGQSGVLCLLSDSMQAETPGYTTSDAFLYKEMSNAFGGANGRMIVGCYTSDLIRIQQVFDAAYENNRKVAVFGKQLKRFFEGAINGGYLNVPEDIHISTDEMRKYEDHELVILVTGSQGDLLEALQKMAKKQHRTIHIDESDTVLLSTPVPMGGEVFVYRTLDLLSRSGAHVISSHKHLRADGHGSQEDLKLMMNLMQPKYLIPVHGEYRALYAHAKIGKEAGISPENILIPDRGDIIECSEKGISQIGKVPAGNVLIDGIGVGDVGNIVLRDRKLLSQDGIFIIVVTINKAKKEVTAGPEVLSRGFVYVRESEKLMEESATKVKEIVETTLLESKHIDWASLKQNIRDQLYSYLFEKTKRRPMILPIIMEV
ncbi:ribonuclease J [Bacillus carboniphilus]|uniref:Ribonuclease J n=1 Tax=Bacillus carboniphilus TaxID=86663 RepID=A0ABP3G291_9BACI